MSNVDPDFNALMKSIYETFRMNIKTILDKAVQNKELKNCNTEKLALFIASALEGAILAAKATGNECDYTDVVDEIIEYMETKR
jgi:TetR/AcrR family transcriptional repressor of nem operon